MVEQYKVLQCTLLFEHIPESVVFINSYNSIKNTLFSDYYRCENKLKKHIKTKIEKICLYILDIGNEYYFINKIKPFRYDTSN